MKFRNGKQILSQIIEKQLMNQVLREQEEVQRKLIEEELEKILIEQTKCDELQASPEYKKQVLDHF